MPHVYPAPSPRHSVAAQDITSLKTIDALRSLQATALIVGLGGERTRWTEDSRKFADTKRRLVGDVALSCAFVGYCGPFNQEFRDYLVKTRYAEGSPQQSKRSTKQLKQPLEQQKQPTKQPRQPRQSPPPLPPTEKMYEVRIGGVCLCRDFFPRIAAALRVISGGVSVYPGGVPPASAQEVLSNL